MSNNIIVGSPIDPNDVEPHEILAVLHKRIVYAEKMVGEYRQILNDVKVEVEMLRDRVAKLEGK